MWKHSQKRIACGNTVKKVFFTSLTWNPTIKNVGSIKKHQGDKFNPVCLKMTTKRSLFVRLVPCRCLRGEEETVTTLDYSHCSLEQVPKEIFTFEKTLEELYLDANQIEELPKQLFNCQSLHKLSLPDNDLTALPASIANLINLRELDVSKNGIQEFPENIKNCKVLTVVEASVNPISKLPDGFSQLLNLTQLYLNDAFLEFLPANFGRLTKLQILELRENQLKMLPKTMNRLTQLERLDLGSNEFTEVPEVLEQLSGLKEFWMDGNRLTFIPGFIGSLKQLTYLDISKNNIEMVEEGISGCENLQDLLLSSNSLQQLPETIGSLKNVTTLKIDENQLMYLPDSIGGLVSIEELDCSFNELEALPSSIGQLTNIRTFAADHNYLQQLPPEIGSWKNITVLFLHSNKLETLPEEMGDMQKLKVINLSDNRLKNLPFSFTKLQQLTAMWLSDNQSKPLIPLQKETDSETQKMVLTNYMFPQQPRTEDVMFISDNESFNPSLWEEQRKQRAQVAFECDEDKDEREAPPREGNLKRYPTPYPDELKNMVKTVQTIVHRLKDEETNEDSGKDLKPHEDQQVVNNDVGVKTSESITPVRSKADEKEKYMIGNSVQKTNEPEAEVSSGNLPVTANVKASENLKHIVNHDDVFEESEELSSDEEMKMAEMRPPLIETSINQPKVVALGSNKKDDTKDTDSLSDEVTHNSNQNNSNCSSPSRMSDSVSLNTDSSQDTSLCSPVKQTHIGINSKIRQEDENFNSLLQNGDILNHSTEEKIKVPDKKDFNLPEYDLNIEERLVLIEKGVDSTATSDESHKLDHINMNLNKLVTNDTFQPEIVERSKTQDTALGMGFLSNNAKGEAEHLENGNKFPNVECINKRLGPGRHGDMWAISPNDRLIPGATRTTIQRQSSVSSAASVNLGEPGSTRRTQVPEGDYLSHRELHSVGRTPMMSGSQRPLSARTYSVDGPHASRPQSARPSVSEIPERTMSVSDFSYSRTSPSKRPNTRVGSEHSLLDPPGKSKVPHDWREQVLRHIEAKKLEKSMLSRSFNSNFTAVSNFHYGSSRDLHGSQGSLALSVADGRGSGGHTFRHPQTSCPGDPCQDDIFISGQQNYPSATLSHKDVLPDSLMKMPLSNGQMGQPLRPQANYSQIHHPLPQASVARHPSREQLIDYLMLKVAHQPPYTQPHCSPRQGHELARQEIRVRVEKDPELGFSISGGVGGRGNPFRPDDDGIFVTRVQPEGPASKLLQPGDKIIQANGYSFINIEHGQAVSLLKTFQNTVELIILREVSS
ncbi:erbin isoform X11 [Bubalus kerabau]|uniref:erbin isoform X11 n=1 Tax=Bubalus carabanensis TaxID=3119969 RepID=UPI00244ECFD5|nr:erbin isoform X11 [Bubalus carabanensis]